jgi:hypothetical protein
LLLQLLLLLLHLLLLRSCCQRVMLQNVARVPVGVM